MTDITNQTEINAAKSIVEKLLCVKINNKSKRAALVEARMIYSSLLKAKGYSLNEIGAPIGKDHATIYWYLGNIDSFMKDQSFAYKHKLCKDSFFSEKNISLIKDFDKLEKELNLAKDMINDLINENKKLITENKKLIHNQEKTKRLSDIIKLINERTPLEQEFFVRDKINTMFNGITYKKQNERTDK